jgi:hypothetical protein
MFKEYSDIKFQDHTFFGRIGETIDGQNTPNCNLKVKAEIDR